MLRYYWPAYIWALIILFLTLLPGQYVAKIDYWNVTSIDKYIHFTIFLIQVWCILLGEKRSGALIDLRSYLFPVLIGIIFGILIEFIQIFIPHRSFDVEDMVANSIGACLGAILFWLAFSRSISQKKV